jgi:anti-sigma factor RsiW
MTGADKLTALEANALADGELSGDAAAEARLAIAGDKDLRAAVAWRDALNAQLHGTYDRELSVPLPARTRRLLAGQPAWAVPPQARRIAAAVAFAVVAGGLGFLIGSRGAGKPDEAERVVTMAQGAHHVFAGEIRHPVEVNGSESAHLGRWLGARLGVQFTAPVIADSGFTLVGGRLLAEGTRPAGLLMYEDAAGLRVTLYVEKRPIRDETGLQQFSNNGLTTFYWADGEVACAVSGKLDAAKLRVVSEQLYAALEKT